MRIELLSLVCAASLPFTLSACHSSAPAPSGKQGPGQPFAVKGDTTVTRVAPQTSGTKATFALLPDGLVITHGERKGQPVSLIRFGDPQVATVAALARDLGTPKESDNRECGAGPMHFADFGAIKANFLDGKFVGWFTERGKGLNTGEGIASGKSYREMERIGAKMVPKSTLEGEFELFGQKGMSGMGGFVGPDEKVVSLHAGTNCYFR